MGSGCAEIGSDGIHVNILIREGIAWFGFLSSVGLEFGHSLGLVMVGSSGPFSVYFWRDTF